MSEVKVMFNTLEDIRKYLRALDSFNGDLDLQYESQIVDGKSLLGILSLGIGKLLNLKLQDVYKRQDKTHIEIFTTISTYAKSATGAALGVSIAYALKAPTLVLFSACLLYTSRCV